MPGSGRRMTVLSSLLLFVALLLPDGQAAAKPAKDILLATTTSTQDSGLLDVLVPMFEKESGYVVKTIAVGSGQAMAMGERGEADCLLVHSPEAEERFVAGGSGVNRQLVMYNDFVIVGPKNDPAGISGVKPAARAMSFIAEAREVFVSRGDNSGTHAREKALWGVAKLSPKGRKWYQESGSGMGQTLMVASEKEGYTLSDRGTFLALGKNISLVVLAEGDRSLLNIYHVIGVNPAKWPKVNAEGAAAFSSFMVSPKAQDVILVFGKEKFGQPLFFPAAGRKVEDLGK